MRAGSSKQTIERFNWRLVTRLLGLPLVSVALQRLGNNIWVTQLARRVRYAKTAPQ